MRVKFPAALDFSNLPTPIVPLRSNWSGDSAVTVWFKRDDLTGLELSGNKVRKLDFLLKEALDRKATHILTCGGAQSNHCRTAAVLAIRLGLTPVLFLKNYQQATPTGNLLLSQLMQPQIIPVSADEYLQIDVRMADMEAKLSEQGYKGYTIPEGGSNPLGIWGYIRCFDEIIRQQRTAETAFDAIVVATGSGGTHAGLLLGKLLYSSPIEVISVNVCDTADFFRRKILAIIRNFNNVFGYNIACSGKDINIFDGFVGAGYGKIDLTEKNIIREFARREGIILDPVYTAKAFLGLQSLLARGEIRAKNVLFIHTGGIFGIFPYAADFFRI
jgi:D-cysteine desulfhydrase